MDPLGASRGGAGGGGAGGERGGGAGESTHARDGWVGFDEIPMTSPMPPREGEDEDENRGRDGLEDTPSPEPIESPTPPRDPFESRRESECDLPPMPDEPHPPPITPLPTEMIADPSRLGAAPVLSTSNEQFLTVGGGGAKRVLNSKKAAPGGVGQPTVGGVELRNGKILCTIYPENSGCAWIIPPRYNPYNMPAVLAADGITLPSEDFVTAMELITNDYRFRAYSTVYGRLVAFWMTLSLAVLLVVLFSSPEGGVPVLVFCLAWMGMLVLGILGCVVIRKQIRVGMRHCVQSANKILIRNDVIAGVEDRGQMSCHKMVIHLMWFRWNECLPDIERLIRVEASGGAVFLGHSEQRHHDVKQLSPREVEEKARLLVLKYSQGYVKDTLKNRIVFPSRPSHGVSDVTPKHCPKHMCICQYVEKKHFNRKPRKWYERLA